MYSYKTGVAQIDRVSGGFEAGTKILIRAPPMRYADQIAYALTKPLQGEYAIVLSTNERTAEVVDAFKLAGADKRFIGVIDAITKSSTPGISVIGGSRKSMGLRVHGDVMRQVC
ncbi:MAG: hypothetical protein ABSG49_08045 [Methanoregula sp.]|jgi:hypothetical protein|uniref:hypothetical protein n=1 Tax=Methanoregula sp. TaxID=2052170 RepID=UPI003C23D1E6